MNFIDKKREIIKFNIYYWMFFLVFCSVFGIFLYISIFDGFCGVCIFLILAMVGCLLMLELAKEAFINIKTIAGLEEMKDKLDILE